MNKKDTNMIGTITELKCITYFLELGYTVSVPQNPTRYDFILDVDNKMYKIQVKTGNTTRKEGCLTFSTSSCHLVNGRYKKVDYREDNIDFFCTYFEKECYLIPVSSCGKTEKSLRFGPTKSGQVKGVCFAKDYIASEVISNQ